MSRRPEGFFPDILDRPLQTGGTSNGMETRVAILEAHIDYIRRDIGDMKGDISILKDDMVDVKVGLATLTVRVDHLPTKGFIVTATASTMALMAALIAFQDHIRAFFSH